MGRGIRVQAAAVTIALVVGLVGGCGGAERDPGPTDPDDPLVRAWGAGVGELDGIELQPDVVTIDGGPRAIRGVADAGLTWRLDPEAGGVDDLAVGSVMLATDYAVGRVLRLRRVGPDLEVLLGPVTLLDIIRNGTLRGEGVPVGEAHERPPAAPLPTDPAPRATATPNGTAGGSAVAAGPPTAYGHGTAFCCNHGAGVRFGFKGGGAKFNGQISLRFAAPKANFYIKIDEGGLEHAEISLSGGFGVHLDFAAGTNTGYNQTIEVPVPGRWSVEVAKIEGTIPVALTISQSLQLTTAFGSKIGEMHSSADYQLASKIGYRYARGGTFESINENNFVRNVSIIGSMGSIAPGAMAVIIRHVVHLSVGVNAYVLDAGIHVDIETSIGATAGSGIGAVALAGSHFVQCRGGALGVYARFGFGFRILGVLADIVNKFLALVNIAPIPSYIGPTSRRVPIFTDTDVSPPGTGLCGTPGEIGALKPDDIKDPPPKPCPDGMAHDPGRPDVQARWRSPDGDPHTRPASASTRAAIPAPAADRDPCQDPPANPDDKNHPQL